MEKGKRVGNLWLPGRCPQCERKDVNVRNNKSKQQQQPNPIHQYLLSSTAPLETPFITLLYSGHLEHLDSRTKW